MGNAVCWVCDGGIQAKSLTLRKWHRKAVQPKLVLFALEKEGGDQDRGGKPKELQLLLWCHFFYEYVNLLSTHVKIHISWNIQIFKCVNYGVGSMNVCYTDVSFKNVFRIFKNCFFKTLQLLSVWGPMRAWTSLGWQTDVLLSLLCPQKPSYNTALTYTVEGMAWPGQQPVKAVH